MPLEQARKLRRLAGWAASVLLFCSLAVLSDGLIAGFKDGTRDFQAIPGDVLDVTAIMPPGAEELAELRVEGDIPGVRVVPEDKFSGFWMGGAMWRGKIHVESGATPGERVFMVEGPILAEKPKRYVPIPFRVVVHPDAASQRQASPSLVTRHTGLNPYSSSLALFLLAVPFGLAGYLLSRRMESLLLAQGKAVVYMVKSEAEGLLIAFSLGTQRGLAPGSAVLLQDPAGREAGMARVLSATDEDSTARVVSGLCRPGYLAVLPDADGASAS